jgi:hypothetical protein
MGRVTGPLWRGKEDAGERGCEEADEPFRWPTLPLITSPSITTPNATTLRLACFSFTDLATSLEETLLFYD